MRPEFIKIGQIVNAHGIRGDLKLNPWRVEPSLLLHAKKFYIDGRCLQPSALRLHKGLVLFRLPGVEDMNTALDYKGKDVLIRPQELPLPKGEYYDEELLGLTVLEADSGRVVGRLTDVLPYPAHPVYQVQGEKNYLIPAVKDVFIISVDPEQGIMQVRLMEGLESDAD